MTHALVLPPDETPTRTVATLLRAYARLLQRRLLEDAPHAVTTRLAALAKEDAATHEAVIAAPTVSVLVQTERASDALPSLALELARRGLLGARVRFAAPVAPLVSQTLGLVVRPPPGTELVVEDGVLVVGGERIDLTDGARALAAHPTAEAAFARITEGITLALHDPNPLAMFEAHPEKQGNAFSLGGRPVSDWTDALGRAMALIERHLPALAEEMRLLLDLVIPVGWEPERHFSASYREYIGAVYVTLHPNVSVLAEALVHEFQHNKLNLLLWHYPVLVNGYDFLYKSPVRPDPRPLMGILLAAHAFVPVAELYTRMRADGDKSIETRLADVIGKNEEALAVLGEHGEPDAAGRALLDELGARHAVHRQVLLAPPTAGTHEA